MPSKLATTAEAVKAALNAAPGGTFSQAFTAERKYLPLFDLEELATLRVSVVAAGFAPTALTRSHVQKELTVDVGVHQRLPEGTDPSSAAANAVIDPLLQLVEEIALFFRPGLYGGASFVSAASETVCDPEQLRANNVFFAFARLTFKTL